MYRQAPGDCVFLAVRHLVSALAALLEQWYVSAAMEKQIWSRYGNLFSSLSVSIFLSEATYSRLLTIWDCFVCLYGTSIVGKYIQSP